MWVISFKVHGRQVYMQKNMVTLDALSPNFSGAQVSTRDPPLRCKQFSAAGPLEKLRTRPLPHCHCLQNGCQGTIKIPGTGSAQGICAFHSRAGLLGPPQCLRRGPVQAFVGPAGRAGNRVVLDHPCVGGYREIIRPSDSGQGSQGPAPSFSVGLAEVTVRVPGGGSSATTN